MRSIIASFFPFSRPNHSVFPHHFLLLSYLHFLRYYFLLLSLIRTQDDDHGLILYHASRYHGDPPAPVISLSMD
jgi:hypothetical protein